MYKIENAFRATEKQFMGENGVMVCRGEHSSNLYPLARSYVCFLWWCVHITDVLSNVSICNISLSALSLLSSGLSFP